MLPKIWIIDSYTLMMILGIASAFLFFELYFRKHLKVKSSQMNPLEICLLLAVIGGIAGAYLFQNLYNFIEDPSSYKWEWSLTFYGGIIGGAIVFFIAYYLYGKKHYTLGLSPLFIVAPGCFTIAHGIGRIGCFLAGCCYGVETTSWIGVKFPELPNKVIPTNLMEAIFLLILSIVLLTLAFKKNFEYNFPIYLVSYGIWRFVIEFYRGDHRGEFVGAISPSQFWSIVLVVLGIGYFVTLLLINKKKKI